MAKRKYPTRISIYLETEKKEQVAEIAKRESRTLSQMAQILLDEAIAARQTAQSQNPA